MLMQVRVLPSDHHVAQGSQSYPYWENNCIYRILLLQQNPQKYIADARQGQTCQTAQMKVKEAPEVGSPVVFIEATPMLKTTDPIQDSFSCGNSRDL